MLQQHSTFADINGILVNRSQYDVIVCGSGSSGSVVARRLADDPQLRVLLLEAGQSDYPASIRDALRWPENLAGPNDWAFISEPNEHLNGRPLMMSMGKVLGGSSSINVMVWARGHQSDWDFFAREAQDDAWNYRSILNIYRQIEDYRGQTDALRGTGGLVAVNQPSDPHPVASALVDAAEAIGIPKFASPNGAMMEAPQGAAISDLRVDGRTRMTIFDSYVAPVLDKPNLTVITNAVVQKVLMEDGRARGVYVLVNGEIRRFMATEQVVLSAGSINTPRILMQSGIGDAEDLRRLGIPVVQHLPGVGRNLQDHLNFGVVFEGTEEIEARANGSEATVYATSGPGVSSPDIVMCQAEFPVCSPELLARYQPSNSWTIVAGLARPKSRGQVMLRSANPADPVLLRLNALSEPEDREVAQAAIRLCRELGASEPARPFVKREAFPGTAYPDLDQFMRDCALPFWHQTCTAKMGHDALSVVDGNLAVYGVEGLMIADGSIMPRITTGNTMAPCVIIGERAAQILEKRFRLGRGAKAELAHSQA